jgi:hypothetical protein
MVSLLDSSSNNKTLNARLLPRHKFVTGATLLQLVSLRARTDDYFLHNVNVGFPKTKIIDAQI